MILSLEELFSDKQAITATAASTNIIDLGVTARDIGKGNPIPLLVKVNEDFNNLTSLTVSVQTDDDSGFGSATTLTEQTKALADLTLGDEFNFKVIPTGVTGRYIRVNYTVTGTAPTTGQVTAGITAGNSEPY